MASKKASKKDQKQGNILGVSVDSTSEEVVLRKIKVNIKKNTKFYVTTPNPEIVMQARNDSKLHRILNKADISIPDGIGLVAANKFLMMPNPNNPIRRAVTLFVQGLGIGFSVLFDRKWLEAEMKLIKGRVIFVKLIELANKKGWKVILIGDSKQSAKKAANALEKNYLKVKLTALVGPDLNKKGIPVSKKDKQIETDVIERINKEKPKLLFIGFGAPKQEKWLYRWFDRLEIGGAMVVGGTFDYISGVSETPPRWVEDMNLEWLWRLLTGSQNVERINKALPQFIQQVFLDKYNLK